LTSLIKKIINIFSVIVGVIAVIMIIIGGLKYITSGGESSNVSGAKNTIIYAIVGLVVVALAQFIVHFVLANTAAI
jgi:cytochrome bd-type quinol oxidase subunit 2